MLDATIVAAEAADAALASLTVSDDSTDDQLIGAAKRYAAAVNGHVKLIQDRKRRAIEDFWRLGTTLTYLRKRHGGEKWGTFVEQKVGISISTANHATRLASLTTWERLGEYRTKTEALEKLGIISRPAPKLTATVPVADTTTTDTTDTAPVAHEAGEDARSDNQVKTAPAPLKHKVRDEVPTPDPTPRDMLVTAVRILEELGTVEASDVDLLDKAAALIANLRSSVAKVAA